MKTLLIALLFSASFALAQDKAPTDNSQAPKGQVTLRGCVSRSNGDYILIKQEPEMTYELQGTHGIRLHKYLGQRVEVTGDSGPTLSSSSDAMNKIGSASPVTITVRSIRTVDKECPTR
jgi:hypothetical protein